MCQSLHPVSLPIQGDTSRGWMAGTSVLIVFLFFVLSIKEGFNLKQQLSVFFSSCPGALCFSDLQVFSYYWKLYSFLLAAASSSQSFSFLFSVMPCFSMLESLWIFWYFWYHEITHFSHLCEWGNIPMPVLSSLSAQERLSGYAEFFVHIFSSFVCCWKCVMHFEFWKNRLARGINFKARFVNKISLWQQ